MPKTKLFLSYGRHDAKDIAERIKKDLEDHGYEVWMDRSEIKTGTRWAEEIQAGLDGSHAMVALLSPHSVRSAGVEGSVDDSVCLDEIAYARECPGKILPVMVAQCSVPFVLYRLHYVDLCAWKDDDEAYARGLQDLLAGVEAAIRNEVRYRTWQTQLQPLEFAPFLEERRRGFVGRDWLLEGVSKWLEDGHEESSLLITGDPGIGKSAFVGQWVHLNPGGRLLAYHCCQVGSPTTLQPHSFVRSIAAMIASQLPAYEQRLDDPAVAEALQEEACRADPARGFDAGILAPLRRIEPPEGGVRCILIDALDEAILIKGGPTIVDVIADRLDSLPPWLKVVATTRRDPAVLRRLERLRATCLEAQDPRNLEDAREYLEDRLSGKLLLPIVQESGIGVPAATDLLLERSHGNFLYLRYALEGLVKGAYHLDRPDEFPPGLPGFYEKAFQHRFTTDAEYDEVAGLLAAVLGAREPLDADLLLAASGLTSQRQLRRALKKLAVYLPEREGRYVIFHRSFAEWLQDCRNNEDFCIEPLQGEKALAELGWAEFQRGSDALSPYMMAHLPHHLASLCRWDQLAALLTDFAVLQRAWADGREHEWMRFWRLLLDRVDMVEAYQRSLDQLIESGADQLEAGRVTIRVGVLLRNLGLAVEARSFAEKAVEILRELPAGHEGDLATALLELAEDYRRIGRFGDAPPLYEEALAIRERLFGPDSPEVADAVHLQCVYYNTSDKRDVERSIELNERAVRILERQDPPDYAALGDAVNDQGVLLDAKMAHREALPYYLRSRELFEKGFPEGHPEQGVVISNIARNYHRARRTAEAIPLHEEGLRMRLLFVVPYDEQCQDIRRCLVSCNLEEQHHATALAWALAVVEQDDKNPTCDVEILHEDLLAIAYAAELAGERGDGDSATRRLAAVPADPDRDLYESTWNSLADFFVFAIRSSLQRGAPDEFQATLQRYRDQLHGADPQPLRAAARFYEGLASTWRQVGLTEMEQEFRRMARRFSVAAERWAPALVRLAEVERRISDDRLDEVRAHVADLFAEAAADDAEWRQTLAARANLLALRLKNEKAAYELAAWFYEQSLKLNPDDAMVISNHAFFLTSIRGEHDAAEREYRRALEQNPDNSNCLSNFAVFHAHVRRNLEEAETLFTRAMALDPDTGSIPGNFAVLRIMQGNLDGAMELARRAHDICGQVSGRLEVRPLFCAIVVSLLRQRDPQPYLAQMKTLIMTGFDRVPWQIDGLMELVRRELPAADVRLLELIFTEVCNGRALPDLEAEERWRAARPLPLDRPWPRDED